jgi:hypothetical protein
MVTPGVWCVWCVGSDKLHDNRPAEAETGGLPGPWTVVTSKDIQAVHGAG